MLLTGELERKIKTDLSKFKHLPTPGKRWPRAQLEMNVYIQKNFKKGIYQGLVSDKNWNTTAKKQNKPTCLPTDGWLKKMWLYHNGILFSHKKLRDHFCREMHGTRYDCYVKINKPDSEILCGFSHMQNLDVRERRERGAAERKREREREKEGEGMCLTFCEKPGEEKK